MSEAVDHSQDLTQRILDRLRKRFYRDQEKFYFQEENLLKQAVFYPARYLDDRSFSLPTGKYESLLLKVIGTVVAEGDLAAIRSPGRYLLHAVQKHMKHHGEEYLKEARTFQSALDAVMHGIRKTKPVLADATVPALAAAHKVLAQKSAAKKKVVKTQQEQLGLL